MEISNKQVGRWVESLCFELRRIQKTLNGNYPSQALAAICDNLWQVHNVLEGKDDEELPF